jgi:chromosome segregation ATPase
MAVWRSAEVQILDMDAELEVGLAGLDAEVVAARGAYEEAAGALAQQRAALVECDAGIAELAAQRAELERQATDAAVSRKKLEHKCAGCSLPLARQRHPNQQPCPPSNLQYMLLT